MFAIGPLMSLMCILVATQTYAATTPAPPIPSGLVKAKYVALKTLETPSGTLTYYGFGSESGINTTEPSPSLVSKRCGSNAVGCDGSNVPGTDPCARLIFGSGIETNNSVLGNSVRAICLNSSSQCCISWGAPTTNLPLSALFKAAEKTYNTCVTRGQSGFSRDTNLNGVCTDQCLSNRPDGCT